MKNLNLSTICSIIAIITALYFCFSAYSTIQSNAKEIDQIHKEMTESRYWIMMYMSARPVEKN